ncbi:MAG: ABC transporter permease [Candidatus Aminicenantes bacterium]|nr:ABC transporter permease [Candidatus Aminicenantes bacterium]
MATKKVVSARFASRCKRLTRPLNRTILLELVRANIKASDYHSFLGGLWSLIGTTVMLVSFYYVFSKHFGRGIAGYPLYLLSGIILVNFFITATSYLLKVLSFNRDIALNSTIPRENLVLATISINAWKFAIELAICTMISVIYGFYAWRSALLFIPILLSFLALVLGVGLALSLSFCFARDVEHVWAIFSRLFLFVTPVFYTVESMSPTMRLLISYLNPLTPYLKALRAIFMKGGMLEVSVLLHCVFMGTATLGASYLIFLRWEGEALDRT